MKRVFNIILGVLALSVALTFAFGYDYLFNAVRFTYLKGKSGPNIDDGYLFPKSPIINGIAQPWPQDSMYNKQKLSVELLNHLNKTQTASFLVIKNGNLLSENYWENYHQATLTNSFSMAKTVTVMLAQMAVQDGKLRNMNQKLSDFFPDFKKDKFGKDCTLKDLATMESGLDWEENYQNPLKPNAKAYFGNNMAQWILHKKFKAKPGSQFEYQSGTTQLLGFAVREAIGMPLGAYASVKLWQPLGMEYPAYWGMDQKDGMEKAYCCVNATSRDFAKLGQLLLNNGQWNGTQILDSDFVQEMTKGTKLSKGAYGWGIWTNEDAKIKHYYLRGLYGQYVICIPEYDMIIVRTGSSRNEDKDEKGRPQEVAFFVDEVVKTFQ